MNSDPIKYILSRFFASSNKLPQMPISEIRIAAAIFIRFIHT